MANYIPAFESQRDQNAPTPWTNCNPASHAILLDQWSYGRIDTHDIDIRIASGVRIQYGTSFADNARALKRMFGLELLYSDVNNPSPRQMNWRQLRDHLAQDGGAVVCGYYQSLRPYTSIDGKSLVRWQPQGSFGHAMFVCDYDPKTETVLLMDPLGHGGYEGDRISLSALWAFIWKRGNDPEALVTASFGFTNARPPRGETRQEREARLAQEAVALRKLMPDAMEAWHRNTGMKPDYVGELTREMRLAAEVLYGRRMKELEGK